MLSLQQALDAATTAQNHLTDVGNQAAGLYNSGQVAASVGLLKSQGESALADLTQKVAAVDQAVAQFRAAAGHLQEALNG